MVRQARIYLPNTPSVIKIQGHNQSNIFTSSQDTSHWLELMQSIVPAHRVQIHAFSLLVNKKYLLVSSQEPDGLSKFIQDLGRRYVRYFNGQYQRTGTLWDGRYKMAYIQDVYLIPVSIWLDGLSIDSSWLSHTGAQLPPGFLEDHQAFWKLGNTPFDRQINYKNQLEMGNPSKLNLWFEQCINSGHVIGDEPFVNQAEQQSGQVLKPSPRGRPKKTSKNFDQSDA